MNKEYTETSNSLEQEDNLPAFFSRYYPMFVAFAQNYLPDRDMCEDVVQEAFVVWIEHKGEFQNEYSAKSFLYKTIRNKCLNDLRHQQIHCRYAEMQVSQYDKTKESEGFFIESIIREEASLIIARAIEMLPEMGQQILNMAIDGLSNQEIADHLRISINTVRTHKSRAYKTLRVVLSSLRLL